MQRSDRVTEDLTYDNFKHLVVKSKTDLFDIFQTITNSFGKANLLSSSSVQANNSTILSGLNNRLIFLSYIFLKKLFFILLFFLVCATL